MPEPTPFVKVAATRGYGARVVLAGEVLADAQAEAERIASEEDLVWVHPYDDAAIISAKARLRWKCWRTSRISTASSFRSAAAD